MKNDPRYSQKVLIDEQSSPGMKTTRNPHSVDNVNVSQGPRTGNVGEPAKRAEFKSAKAEREPLAAVITGAFGRRTPADHINPKLEGVMSDVAPKKFAR
jgi:hypothetical protein